MKKTEQAQGYLSCHLFSYFDFFGKCLPKFVTCLPFIIIFNFYYIF